MAFKIALQFEDGVTRVIECGEDELVCDAAFRAKINVPLDCRDGACGTCKCHCESGEYEMGFYIEDALTEDEAAERQVLTCQMKPKSDCVINVPVSAAACKTEVAAHGGRLAAINRGSPTTVTFTLSPDQPVAFLPGQYVNLQVPGSKETRSYSFSSGPNQRELSFLIRDVPEGLMSTYMRSKANDGDFLMFTGPYGRFYLRTPERPILMLAGGTGLAPFLSMLRWLREHPSEHPIMLAYGVNGNDDLVELEALEELRSALPAFNYFTVVVDPASDHPRIGYVTDHLGAEHLHGGEVDIYVCGPPPMVEGVRRWMDSTGTQARNFLFEKFSATEAVAA